MPLLHVFFTPPDYPETDYIVEADERAFESLDARLYDMVKRDVLYSYSLVWIDNSVSPMSDLIADLDDWEE